MRRLLLLISTAIIAFPVAANERWLVELEAPAIAERELTLGKRADSGTHATWIAEIDAAEVAALRGLAKSAKRAPLPIHRYRHAASGFAIALSAAEAAVLSRQPGVARLTPDFTRNTATESSVAWVGAPAVWSRPGGRRGAGMVAGVIDTGINAAHPAFAGVSSDGHSHVNPRGRVYGLCTQPAQQARCNAKLIGIYDFTDEGARDGADADGHGSHVASTVVGNPVTLVQAQPTISQSLTITGVAPRAALISYKACRQRTDEAPDSCRGSDLIAAIDQATADRVDVINYSIGGAAGDAFAALGAGLSDYRSFFLARAAGVLPVASAGNSGPAPATVTAPANAPWVLAVAATSKDRQYRSSLLDLTGTPPAPQSRYDGESLSAALPSRPIVLAESFGSRLCSNGDLLDFPPTGASNPFASGTFQGQIVVCERGLNARVAKSFNLQQAGAGGMILVNTPLEGESINADGHFLPTTHLGQADGAELVAWLRQAGASARGRIGATESISAPGRADILASFSSRGPASGGLPKPNLSAPGVGIFAAAGTGNGAATLSGTSMAAPHVAGAALLLKAEQPTLPVDALESMLQLTASRSVRRSDGQSAALLNEGGSGRVQVDTASAAALYLPLSNSAYAAAVSSSLAERQRNLNLPSLYTDACIGSCSFERRVRALRAGSWRIETVMPAGVTLSANTGSFSLAANAEQALTVSARIDDPARYGETLEGALRIVPQDAGSGPELTLPVSLRFSPGALPERLALSVARDLGRTQITLPNGLQPTKQLRAEAAGFGPRNSADLNTGPDPTGANPYNADGGTLLRFIDVPSGALLLEVSTLASSVNVDLYVGRDLQSDSVVDASEVQCRSNQFGTAIERCRIELPTPGRWWLLAQNRGTGSQVSRIGVDWAIAAPGTNPGLIAQLPAVTAPGQPLVLTLDHDLGGLTADAAHLGAVALYAADAATRPFAVLPIDLPAGPRTPASRVLPPGQPTALTIPGSGSHRQLAIDVPTGTTQLTLDMEGSGNADLRLLLGDADSAASPSLPPADLAAAPLASASGPDSRERLVLANPAPGRYAVVIQAADTREARVTLTTTITAPRGPDPVTEFWFNPMRDGHGVVLTRARDDLQLVWYSYDQDRRPTWYLAFFDGYYARSPATATASLLTGRWDGGRARLSPVGRATLTPLSAERLLFGYQVAGVSHSETLVRLTQRGCIDIDGRRLDLGGLWFEPARDGYGANWFTGAGTEVIVTYLYDGLGQPRWWYGQQSTPLAGNWPLREFRGPCPGCEALAPSSQPVGSFERVQIDTQPALQGAVRTGRWRFSGTFAGSNEGFTADGVISLLTTPTLCPP